MVYVKQEQLIQCKIYDLGKTNLFHQLKKCIFRIVNLRFEIKINGECRSIRMCFDNIILTNTGIRKLTSMDEIKYDIKQLITAKVDNYGGGEIELRK